MPSSIHKKPEPYDLGNLSVMVVEDSVYMQTLVTEMLRIFGVGDVLVCDNAKEAMDLITITGARSSSRHIMKTDIIIMDWLMPNGSGKELLNWVRTHESEEVRFMPVIVVSGYTTEKVTNETRDMGANELLVKPISGKLLASRICSVIDNPRPFIKTPDFFGPDRRRQDVEFMGVDRRSEEPNIVERSI